MMAKNFWLLMAVAGLFVFAGMTAAQNPRFSARDVFESSIDSSPAQAVPGAKDTGRKPFNGQPTVLALRYAILKLSSDDSYLEVLPETVFHANDQIRLRVTSNQQGYLYIVQQGSSGIWRLLFPIPEIDRNNGLIKGKQPYNVPGDPGDNFVIDNHPGKERIFILLARKPVADIDQLIGPLRQNNASQARDSAFNEAERTVRNGVIEKLLGKPRDVIETEINQPGQEKAIYVANINVSSRMEDQIMVDLKLNHQ